MKCELHLLQFHIIRGSLKCICGCYEVGFKTAVYLNIIRRRTIGMQYICF